MKPALILALLAVQSPVRVATTLSSESVAPGETFELRVRVETGGATADIALGRLPAGIEVVQAASESVLQSNFPAGSTRVTTQVWVLVGRVTGTFVLPAASVRAGGREYPGRSVVVKVGPPSLGAGLGLTVPPRLSVSAEPRRAFVGQPVTFRAEAMFPRELRSRLTRPATYEPPAAPGFWVVDLPDPMSLRLQRVGAEIYEVQTHRRVYVPIIPGRHVLTPARLAFEVRTGLVQPPQSGFVLSDSLTVEVLPLPAAGRPAAFSGAVGRYTMRAHIEPQAIAVGDAAAVVVEVQGKGDVRSLSPPILRAEGPVEVLPPSEETEADLSGDEIGGRTLFRWEVIPREPGRVALPPVEFAFFDPAAAAYRVIRSDSLILDVTGFTGSDEAQGLSPVDLSRSRPVLDFVNTPAFAIAQAVPLLLLLIAWIRGRRDRPPEAPESQKAESVGPAIARLRSMARSGNPAVPDELAAVLRSALAVLPDEPTAAGDGGPGAGLSRRRRDLEALVADVDRIRFAPARPPSAVIALADRAANVLGGGSSHGGPTARVLPLLLLPALLAGPPQNPAPGRVDAFDRGLVALFRRDAATARDAFREHLAVHPRDASAWYNLGNAAYRLGDRGVAVHAWLQALALEPRRADARHNLVNVAGFGTTRLLPSRFAIDDRVALLVFSVIWWAGVLLGITIRRRRRQLATFLAITLTATAASWLLGRSGPALATARGDATALRPEPAFQSDPVRILPAGEPVQLLDSAAAWIRVRSANGEEGWIESTSLRRIIVGDVELSVNN